MQEILSSQGKVDLNSVHKLQQQSLIVLLPLTQTYCSIFYPCNNMLHRFMHADAQAAHLTLQPAPWSPLSLPGPHKHPRGRLRAPGNDGQQVASAAKKLPLQKEPLTDHSCLLTFFSETPQISLCLCSLCVQTYTAFCSQMQYCIASAPTYYWA